MHDTSLEDLFIALVDVEASGGMSSATALSWFARHELRLAWREWFAMMTGGRRRRTRAAAIGLIVFAALMHLPAWAVIGRYATLEAPLDKTSLIVIISTVFLAWALMLSQAIESVTRVFYARADLDLIMSSPARLANVFSIRIAAIALTVTVMALLLSTPFVDVLVIGGGARWFAAFGVVIAIGLSAAAIAIAVTIVLFRLIGPARTRLRGPDPRRDHRRRLRHRAAGRRDHVLRHAIALRVLTSDAVASYAPDVDSIWWWPARATMGDSEALLLLLAIGPRRCSACVMAIFSGALPTPRSARRPMAIRPHGEGRGHSAADRGSRRCGARNSCCCGAIPG